MNFVAFSVVSDQKWRLRIVQPALRQNGFRPGIGIAVSAEILSGSSDTWQNIFYNMEGCVCLKKAGGKNGIIGIRCKNQKSRKWGVSYDSTDECI